MADGSEGTLRRKKDREPIITLCLILVAIASIVVIIAYVDEHYIQDNSVEAEDGYTVVVDYTGSFYDYYDADDKGVIFQTTVKNIDDNTDYLKSNGYSFNSSTFSVTIGKGDALPLFEDALKGIKKGETVRVTIPGDQAYASADTTRLVDGECVITSPVSMTVKDFKDEYGFEPQGVMKLASGYGWDSLFTYNETTGNVDIQPLAEKGKTYQVTEDDYKYGKVSTEVTDVVGGKVTFVWKIEGQKTGGTFELQDGTVMDEIRMIELDIDGETHYITGVSDDGSFCWKTGNENSNMTLYFVIKALSVSR